MGEMGVAGAPVAGRRGDPAATPGAPHAPPLSLHGISVGYGRIQVLSGIDIRLVHGSVLALLGPNGAGKSTTLGVMSGLLTPWSGCRHVAGLHVNGAGAAELARLGICHIREGRSVFPNLSVSDNLRVAAASGAPRSRLEEVAYELFPILGARRNQLAGTLSGGEQQMLSLARGLGADPAVLLIDELSMGLAPLVVSQLYEAVSAVAALGVAVLVVEQFVTIAMQYARDVLVMNHGRIVFSGPSKSADEAIHQAYLGARPT